jgi:hypothetical protein
MTSLFAAEMQDFSAAIDEALGATFIWAPMMESADVNAATVPDTGRSGGPIQGVFTDKEAKPLIPNNFDPRTDERPGTMSGVPHIDILPDQTTGIPIDIRRGDTLTSDVGQVWVVSSAFPVKSGMVICAVNAVG